PRAARALLLAGEQALAHFATADAEVLLTQAVDAAERIGAAELLSRGLLSRGRAREISGAFRQALGDFHAGLATARTAGDRRHEMLALRELGGLTPTVLGVPVLECVSRLRDGLVIAGSLGDRAVEANLLALLAIFHTNRLQFDEALRFGQRAVAAGRASRSDQALAAGLDGLKNVYAYLGESQPLTRAIDELQSVLSRLGDLALLQWAMFESSVPAIAAADWADAEHRMGDAVAISRRGGLVGHESWFIAHLGWLARLQGQLDLAVERGREAVDLVPDAGRAWFGPGACACLAGTLMELGDPAGAIELLDDGLRHANIDGAEGYRLRCLAPLAELSGDPAVLKEADALLAGITAPPGCAWMLGADVYLSVARAWLGGGKPERAREVLRPLLTAAERLGWEPVLATAGLVDGHAAGALGDRAAAQSLAAVAERADRCGMPLVAAAARRTSS
ncbi:MAG: hypothetical protein L0H84_08620, partial [Pseudonocardia sp.]|nr:hypothetical protein [Pseudonocardia sp.]